jgi:microcystin-dependent protein
MAQPYVGEIRMFGGTFAPAGWADCNGQQLPISENETLFQLIGTTYGGDGQENFNLPNLQGRIPMHFGNGPTGITYPIAETAGTTQETLTVQQMPVHNHALMATGNPGGSPNPGNQLLAQGLNVKLYIGDAPTTNLNAQVVMPAGGSQPHSNEMPYLVVRFIISLFGIFPSPT